MTNTQLIPESTDREVDWTLDPEAGAPMGQPDDARTPLHAVSNQFQMNVLATIVARVVNMARGVCVVPFLLARIGLEAYGIWTTIFILVGYVGGLLGTMPDTRFWLLHVGLMAASAALLLVARMLFGHLLAPTRAEPAAA